MIKILLIDFTNVIYQPFDHKQPINQELIEFIKQQQGHLDCYVFSASKPQVLAEYRSQLIPPFTDFISSQELNLTKHQTQSYQFLAKKLEVKPTEILFVDDKLKNVTAAYKTGCHVIHFQNTQQFLTKVATYL